MKNGKICVITGAGGLIGSECVKYYCERFYKVIGIDNNSRRIFFGSNSSVSNVISNLQNTYGNYYHHDVDITNYKDIHDILAGHPGVYNGPPNYEVLSKIDLIIHCAAQPSHDLAAEFPRSDFEINAVGTLNLLEAYRQNCPGAVFIFTSTNKVYGDTPNRFADKSYVDNNVYLFEELETRYEVQRFTNSTIKLYEPHPGINERMSIDNTTHSLFGVSKASADLMVQEYGRYFGLKTGIFRGGCLTGPGHKGAEQHGFLSYLVKCIKHEKPYTIYGYKGKQVRDNIHAYDVVTAFDEFYKNPKSGAVYNIGGGRHSNCSILEAIKIIEDKTGKKAITNYVDEPRKGDHIWYITNMNRFRMDYPAWQYKYDLHQIIDEIIQSA